MKDAEIPYYCSSVPTEYQFLIEVMKEQHFVCYSDNNTTFRECQVLFFKNRAIYLVCSALLSEIIVKIRKCLRKKYEFN